MSKYYLDLLCFDAVPEPYQKSADDIMKYSGVNLGNLVFRHALKYLIKDIDSYQVVNWPEFSQLLEKTKPESVIVSCANWLGCSDQDERSNLHRAKIIESIDAPVISFGLGCQLQNPDEGANQLGENTKRLAVSLSSKCEKISVRDAKTKQILEEIGVFNAVVTGCPSNFINNDPNLGEKISEKSIYLMDKYKGWDELRCSISEFSGGHKFSGAVLDKTIEILSKTSSFYVLQSPSILSYLLKEEGAVLNSAYYSNAACLNNSKKDIENVINSSALHFSSVDSWLDFSRTCDLAFGMRIHGNMVPIQAGVPSVLIAHDSRTQGLADVMGVPKISPELFSSSTFDEIPLILLKEISVAMKSYDKKRKELAKIMSEYLKDNGLSSSESLVKLAY